MRQYALKEFGPMVLTVFESWGIRCTEDIGNMVFNLIEAGIFGKTEEDSIEDFKDVYDFEQAFVKPFAPVKAIGAAPSRPELPAPQRARDSERAGLVRHGQRGRGRARRRRSLAHSRAHALQRDHDKIDKSDRAENPGRRRLHQRLYVL